MISLDSLGRHAALKSRVLLHAEGDERTGLGHLVRMVGVAGELASRHFIHIASSSKFFDHVVADLAPWSTGDFTVHRLPASDALPWLRGRDFAADLVSLAQDVRPDLFVSDGKVNFPAGGFAPLRDRLPIAFVDNVEASEIECDWLILPTSHADPEVLARLGPGRVYTGPEWTFLHPAIRQLAKSSNRPRSGVFVSMGGADPTGLTLQAVRTLLATQAEPVCAVVGRANLQRLALEALARAEPRLSLVSGSPRTHEALAAARWAVCAFGITAYEAVALCIPLVVVPHEGVIDGDIERFAKSIGGVAIVTGVEETLTPPLTPPSPPSALGGLARGIGQLVVCATSCRTIRSRT